MDRIRAAVAACLILVVAAALVVLFSQPGDDGWTKVPRDNYQYKQLPGEEVVIRGLLEANDMTILAIPTGGNPVIITEAEVDSLVSEGLKDQYDFRSPGWTHRIRVEAAGIEPNFIIGGKTYYVILSSGTEVWRSEDLLREYEDAEVEILGKWDSYVMFEHPTISVNQFRPRSIRRVE